MHTSAIIMTNFHTIKTQPQNPSYPKRTKWSLMSHLTRSFRGVEAAVIEVAAKSPVPALPVDSGFDSSLNCLRLGNKATSEA